MELDFRNFKSHRAWASIFGVILEVMRICRIFGHRKKFWTLEMNKVQKILVWVCFGVLFGIIEIPS